MITLSLVGEKEKVTLVAHTQEDFAWWCTTLGKLPITFSE